MHKENDMALLEIKNLKTSFFTDAGEVRAVNDISYTFSFFLIKYLTKNNSYVII